MIDDKKKIVVIPIQEKQIPVWLYGNSANPPLILIHGYPLGWSQWTGDLPVRFLIKSHYCIAFDLPGFGKSKNLKIESIVFIEELRKHFGYKKINLFGGSYGGLVALTYTYHYPNHVEKLIIGGTPYYPLVLLKLFFPFSLLHFHFLLRAITYFSFLTKDNLAQVTVPVLLLYSKDDKLARPWMARKLQKMLPNAKLVIIEGRMHSWLFHRIDQNGFLPAIQKFLQGRN